MLWLRLEEEVLLLDVCVIDSWEPRTVKYGMYDLVKSLDEEMKFEQSNSVVLRRKVHRLCSVSMKGTISLSEKDQTRSYLPLVHTSH